MLGEDSLAVKVAYLCHYMSASKKHPLKTFFDISDIKDPITLEKIYEQSLKTNNTEVFNYLLQHPNFIPDCFAYYWLLALNKTEEMEKLKGSIKNIDDKEIWKEAIRQGYYPIVEYFINIKNFDPSEKNNFAIRKAAENGLTETVSLLLQVERVDPSDLGNYAIGLAAENGHVEVVNLLMQDDRVDPSADDNYALKLAAEKGHVEVVKLLLQDQRVDPSACDNYALRLAAEKGYVEVVKLLLQDKRVDPSALGNYAIKRAGTVLAYRL